MSGATWVTLLGRDTPDRAVGLGRRLKARGRGGAKALAQPLEQ